MIMKELRVSNRVVIAETLVENTNLVLAWMTMTRFKKQESKVFLTKFSERRND